MTSIAALLFILLTLSAFGSEGTVFLSASLSQEQNRLTLSFLSNSPRKIKGTELIFERKTTKKKVILNYEVDSFSDRTYEVPLPGFIKISELHLWKIRTADEVVKPSAIALRPETSKAELPQGWKLTAGKLMIPSGSYRIQKNLSIDQALDVHIEKNTTLLLGPEVSVFLKGRFQITGLSIRPLDPVSTWKNFVLHSYGEKSVLRDVSIEGGLDGLIAGINHTCALCLYGGEFIVENLSVRKTFAEDGLNAKDVTLQMTRSNFEETAGDAFDCDFCQLEVKDSHFSKIKGDALDVSTSEVVVSDNTFKQIGDKALSIGEGSAVKVQKNLFSEASIGVAVKDASRADIIENGFKKCKVNLALYRKKVFWLKGGSATLRKNSWDRDLRQIDEYSTFSE